MSYSTQIIMIIQVAYTLQNSSVSVVLHNVVTVTSLLSAPRFLSM